MKNNWKNIIFTTCIGLVWLLLALTAWFQMPQEISESERRRLRQAPQLEMESVLSGSFMRDFEEYSKDQFPYRFSLRTLKAFTRLYLLFQKENNNIYIEDGYAVKLEYPLNENSIMTAKKKFLYVYQKYLHNNPNVFIAIIPDKNYYLGARNGYPTMDYERLFSMVKEGANFAEYIDIVDLLTIEDFYRTDIHWKQENLEKVARKIGEALGFADELTMDFERIATNIPFNGVYSGQVALPLAPDHIVYLTNNTIKNSTVYNLETDKLTAVYDLEEMTGRDPYDVYLYGASPLLVIENKNAVTDKELIVFRDSFGSSLMPLLLEGYTKITLIDIRYISSDLLGDYIKFTDQDVLFLYNTLILNAATVLK